MATILVADDKGGSRQALASLFGYAGHQVLEAADGAAALGLVTSAQPDLLFTDVVLPVIDGLELTRRIRSEAASATMPVVFYTGACRGAGFRRLAAELDVAAVIAKPAEPGVILNAIGGILGEAPTSHRQLLQAQLTELLLETLPSGSRERKCVQPVGEVGGRIRDLVRRMLVFGPRDEAVRGPIDLASIFADSVSFLRTKLPAGIELRSCARPDTAIVEGNTGQIQQILLNLCVNAADAIAASDKTRSGAIDMSLDRIDLAEPLDAVDDRIVPGRYYRLRVADNGCGMSAATITRIFEPFYTTKASGKRAGLGLAMVHKFVGAHSGHLRVTSWPGAGTVFEIYLPAGDGRARQH